ncbi:hypothetical protein, partial [Nocardia alni]|uniref:hypothetical protein n=1 Tax=Nocardia alni TaxID=2815723 RepID=UPI001C2452A0
MGVPASDTEITALANRVATARGKLPLQSDPALFAELSEAEISAERELAEWMRAQRRKQRRRAVSSELTAEKRDRRVAWALRRADDDDARWHRRALAARRRVSNPDARLAQLYRRAEWSSRALIGVVVLGMLWSGVNVQHNLAPGGNMADPLYWLSYGFEAMISIPIITIMVVATTAARWGREIARGRVVFLEAALLGVTIALNAGPHLAAGEVARAAEAAVAPVMVGVVIWLHAWVSTRYAQLIDAVPVDLGSTPDEPTREYPATTVEFGEPCRATCAEFPSDATESAALPIGHTAHPDADPFNLADRFGATTRFAAEAPQFDQVGPKPAQPQPLTEPPRAATPRPITEPPRADSPQPITDLPHADAPHSQPITDLPHADTPQPQPITEPLHDDTPQPVEHPIAPAPGNVVSGAQPTPHAEPGAAKPQQPAVAEPAPSQDVATARSEQSIAEPVPVSAPLQATTTAPERSATAEPAGIPHADTRIDAQADKTDNHTTIQHPDTVITTSAQHPYDRRPTTPAEPPRPTPAERGTQLSLDEPAP